MIWTEVTYTVEYDYKYSHIIIYMNKQMNNDLIVSLILRVLYTKWIKMCTICRDSIAWRTNNGCKIVLRRHTYQQWSAIDQNVLFWRSAKQATIYKWFSRFWLRCSDVHMRRKMVTDSWYSTINRLTVGDVHRTLTLCKQKQTSTSCATNGERSTRNSSNQLWTCLSQQIRLEHFEIISSVSISNYYRSSHVAHAKICV